MSALGCKAVLARMTRKKYQSAPDNCNFSEPDRQKFHISDIFCAAIGDILSSSVIVVSGVVVRKKAGPSAIVSFLVCSLSALLCSLSYADLATRLPQTHGSFKFIYATLGEFVAFSVAWVTVSDYIVSCAAIAKSISSTVDTFTNHSIGESLTMVAGLPSLPGLCKYPDVIALGVQLAVMYVVSSGIHMSWKFVVTQFAGSVVTVVTLSSCCLVHAQAANLDPSPGGFLPYSLTGMLSGAATAFYSFFGFETALVSASRVDTPAKIIPVVLSVSVITSAGFMSVAAAALVLLLPFYQTPVVSPFAAALYRLDYTVTAYVSGVLSVMVLFTALFSHTYSIPRLVRLLVNDGLVPSSPEDRLVSTMTCGGVSAFLALLVDYDTLVDMLSVGTLVTFTIIDTAVIWLRQDDQLSSDSTRSLLPNEMANSGLCGRLAGKTPRSFSAPWLWLFILIIFTLALSVCVRFLYADLVAAIWWAILIVVILVLGLITVKIIIVLLFRATDKDQAFSVPIGVPLISILLNSLLLVNLDWKSWVRLATWSALGCFIYFGYMVSRNGSPDVTDGGRSGKDAEMRHTPIPQCNLKS